MEDKIESLEKRLDGLEASDRRQWKKIKAQRRYTKLFGGILLLAGLLHFNWDSISPDNKAMMERITTGVLVASIGGVYAANDERFKPNGDE